MRMIFDSGLSLPGRSDKPNEDAFGHGDNAAWIIDGATGQGADVYVAGLGETDAFWLAQKMNEAFARLSGPDAPPLGGAEFYTQARIKILAAFNAQARKTPEADYAFPSAAASRIVLDGDRLICDSLGDCTILLRGKDGAVEVYGGDPVMLACDGRAKEELVRLRESGDISPDMEPLAARSQLLPFIRKNRNLANEVGGYGSFTLSKSIPADRVRTATFPAAALTHALLLSDGFYALVDDYRVMTDAALFEAALLDGLPSLGRTLRATEDADPRGITYPRFKKSDDATAVLFRLEP